MRGLIMLLGSLVVLAASGQVLAECACGYPARTHHPCPRCIGHHAHPAAQGDKAVYQQQEAPAPPAGAYAAPPRTGTQAGETRALGIEGMSIEFPALRLKLPSLRLPALTHYRTGPRMLVDEAVAGYVTEYREEMSFESGPAQQQFGPQQIDKNGTSQQKNGGLGDLNMPAAPDIQAGTTRSGSASSLASLEAEYRERLQRMEQMEKRLEWQIQRLSELTAAMSSAPAPGVLVPTAYTRSIDERSSGSNPGVGMPVDAEVNGGSARDALTAKPSVIERVGHELSRLRPGMRDVPDSRIR